MIESNRSMAKVTPNKSASVPDRESQLGTFVRARRDAAGMNQRQLAELAGVGTRVVSELERGKPTLRIDVVNRVLAVFGKRLGVIDAPRETES
jgi:HTH-type transcriptional regulator / antitoxin HipB